MAIKDYYNTNDNNSGGFYDTSWLAQIFKASSNYDIASVKLKLWKVNSPGTITVSIKAVDASSPPKPTGADLASGTTNGDTLPTSVGAAEWREITFSSSYSLTSGQQYAIVVKAAGDSSNVGRWNYNNSSPTYSDGHYAATTNSGVSWSTFITIDLMFETYSAPSYITMSATGGGESGGSATLDSFTPVEIDATGGGESGGSATLDSISYELLEATGGGESGGSAVLAAIVLLSATGGGTSSVVGVLRRQRYYRIARRLLAICNNKVYYG